MLLLGLGAAQARKGVVVAHYGSSNDRTRALTIDKIAADVAEAVGPEVPVVEAYISPVVRGAMKRKGLTVLSPVDAMLALRAQGVDTLIVQPSLIIDGGEMAELSRDAGSVRKFFSEVRVGRPLCYSPADFEAVVDILEAEDVGDADAIVFVGHGNELPSTATYTQLDYMLADRGLVGWHVSTIEGYPTAETTMRQLRRDERITGRAIRKVKLVPLLLVCGNHTLEDISGEYAQRMREAGFDPEVLLRGLGELPQVRQIYARRAAELASGEK